MGSWTRRNKPRRIHLEKRQSGLGACQSAGNPVRNRADDSPHAPGAKGADIVNNVDCPIYAIARGDVFLSVAGTPRGTLAVWGREKDARRAIRKVAKQEGVPPSLFRICEYRFTGRVLEG
jgi:hypothetical protein